MRFISYTTNDIYYEFVAENGTKVLIPASNVILIDDDSGFISIKLTATRKVIGVVPKN